MKWKDCFVNRQPVIHRVHQSWAEIQPIRLNESQGKKIQKYEKEENFEKGKFKKKNPFLFQIILLDGKRSLNVNIFLKQFRT